MSKFLTKLDVVLVSEEDGVWELCSDLLYSSDAAGCVIRVPAGFKTDFASVPRVPIIFELLGDTAHAAATIHDYLYYSGELGKELADDVFREAAITSGLPYWKSFMMWAAVRMLGANRYNDLQLQRQLRDQ